MEGASDSRQVRLRLLSVRMRTKQMFHGDWTNWQWSSSAMNAARLFNWSEAFALVHRSA